MTSSPRKGPRGSRSASPPPPSRFPPVRRPVVLGAGFDPGGGPAPARPAFPRRRDFLFLATRRRYSPLMKWNDDGTGEGTSDGAPYASTISSCSRSGIVRGSGTSLPSTNACSVLLPLVQ